MRIIAGRFGGRRLRVPPGVIRPAMDQLRESVFGTLGPLDGLAFLDLFAGSGSVGLEAASRGAARVVFVESDRKKIATLQRNVSDILGDEQFPAEIVPRPVERFIAQYRQFRDFDASSRAANSRAQAGSRESAGSPEIAAEGDKVQPGHHAFHVIFADPPFPYKKRSELLTKIGASTLAAPDAWILVHYPEEDPLPDTIPGLEWIKEKRFGRSHVRFFQKVSTIL